MSLVQHGGKPFFAKAVVGPGCRRALGLGTAAELAAVIRDKREAAVTGEVSVRFDRTDA
jgi:hypothetical protein